MAGLLVLITDVDALGLKTAQGLVLTTSFYWDMDDKTREWSKRFFAKMNRMPTMWQAGVYSSVMHYLKAIKAAGTDDPLKVAAKMREMPVEDFFSRNGKLREDGLMVHDLVLVQVKKPEESKYPWDYYQILAHIPGDQAFGPPNPACPLVKRLIGRPRGANCERAGASNPNGRRRARAAVAVGREETDAGIS